MTVRVYEPSRLGLQLTVTRALNRALRFTHQLVGYGAEPPVEPHGWPEFTSELALRRIARQAEADFAGRTS